MDWNWLSTDLLVSININSPFAVANVQPVRANFMGSVSWKPKKTRQTFFDFCFLDDSIWNRNVVLRSGPSILGTASFRCPGLDGSAAGGGGKLHQPVVHGVGSGARTLLVAPVHYY